MLFPGAGITGWPRNEPANLCAMIDARRTDAGTLLSRRPPDVSPTPFLPDHCGFPPYGPVRDIEAWGSASASGPSPRAQHAWMARRYPSHSGDFTRRRESLTHLPAGRVRRFCP
ncbi:hypothetical protein AUP68_06981 [Ilyonectria robusta]